MSLLAATVAVDVGGVEERHAGLRRGVQDGERVVGGDVAPVATELPGTEADDGHRPADAGEWALLHVRSPISGRNGRR